MVTISRKALWIVAIGLTAFYFVLDYFSTEIAGLVSPPRLFLQIFDYFFIGLLFFWGFVVFITIFYSVGKFISRKVKNS